MTDDERSWRETERWRSAWHESGHGIVVYLTTGKPPELLSLRPGQSYRAVTILGEGDTGPEDVDLRAPSILRLDRRTLETRIAVSLAGDLAEAMAGYRRTGYVAETDDEAAAETDAQTLAALSPRYREMLAEAEAAPTMDSDWDRASGSSFVLTWSKDETFWHLQWLRAVTSRLLVGLGQSLRVLAESLFAAGVMDAETFVPLARSGRCACHRWATVDQPKEIPDVSVLSRKPKPVYVATDTGVTELDGQECLFTAGVTRIRAGHPLLKAVPSLFELDESGGKVVEARYSPAYVQPVEDTVVATRSFVHEVYVAGYGLPGRIVVRVGDRFDRRDHIVKAHSDAFEPAPPPDGAA